MGSLTLRVRTEDSVSPMQCGMTVAEVLAVLPHAQHELSAPRREPKSGSSAATNEDAISSEEASWPSSPDGMSRPRVGRSGVERAVDTVRRALPNTQEDAEMTWPL